MHGGWTDEEKYVTLAVSGKSVLKGTIPNANVRDIAAISLYALGIEEPEFSETGWTSQVPERVFKERVNKEYRDISHLTGGKSRVSKIQHTSEDIL